MKTLYTTLLFISITLFSQAQNGVNPNAGARGIAMGDASVAFQDINSIFSNQAGLGFLEETAFTLGAERRFFEGEINSFSLGFAYPMTNAGTFGLSANYYGFSGYNETRIGLAYGRKLMKYLTIGIQADYIGFSIPEYGNKSMFTFEAGLQARLIEDLFIGVHVFSPIRQEIVENEQMATVFRLGANYMPNKKLSLVAELEKDMDFDFVFKAGVEYYLIDILCLRAGISTNPTKNSFGLGLKLKSGIMVDLASSYHYTLGFTPAVSFSYELNKKKKK